MDRSTTRATDTIAQGDTSTGYRAWQGAWIHQSARVADDVEFAPGVVIGAGVEIGARCRLGPNAVVLGPTTVGCDNHIHAGVVLGDEPQDLGYRGEPTRLEIGDRNTFREGFTANRGAPKALGVTRIGNDNFFMANSHVGHDSIVENKCVVANGGLVGGHVHIESNVIISGSTAIIQFATVGRFAFVGGMVPVRKDLEPFMIHDRSTTHPGTRAVGVNIVGLRRGGFDGMAIAKLRKAHRILFREQEGTVGEAVRRRLETEGAVSPEVEELLVFLERKGAGRYGRQLEGSSED